MEVVASFLPRIFAILESEATLFEKIEQFCSEYISQEIKTPYVPIFILNEIKRQPKAFLKKVLGNNKPPIHKLLIKIEKDIKEGVTKPIEPLQLLMNTLSLCILPFLACPMIQLLTG